MNEHNHRWHRVFLAVLALSAAYGAWQYGRAVDNAYSSRTFTVEGVVEVKTANDLATFTATVTTESGLDATAVQNENSQKMNKVLAFLESKGVAKEDMQTENYNAAPRYSVPNCFGGRCEEAKIIGNTVTQNVRVKVRKADEAGMLVSGVVENGATSVSAVTFEVDDNTGAYQEAKIAALADAKKQAQALARAGNFRIGRMITFYEQGEPGVPYPMGGVAMDAALEKAAVTPPVLQPGTSEGKVRMTVTYEIR
jgi:uncharacterized protein